MSAFFLYSQANRARVKEENPEVSFGEVVSVIKTSHFGEKGVFVFVVGKMLVLSIMVSSDARGVTVL